MFFSLYKGIFYNIYIFNKRTHNGYTEHSLSFLQSQESLGYTANINVPLTKYYRVDKIFA